jgi:hypothetical protein
LDGVDIDALYVRRPTSEVGALKYIAPGKMRGREFGREGERAVGRFARVRERHLHRCALEEIESDEVPGPRQPAPDERVARIELSRFDLVAD